MSHHYDDVGKFPDRRAAEDWARRNNIDPRDFHTREANGGVEAAVRRGEGQSRYDDRHGGRRPGY